MTRFSIPLVIAIALATTTASARPGGPRPPGPPPMAPGPEVLEALATELKLKDDQKTKIRDLADEARKKHAKVRAELEVTEIDLRRELDKDEPDEKKVSEHVEKMVQLEGEARKAQLLAWLKMKKVLSKDQQQKLRELHEKEREEMRERHERMRREHEEGGGERPRPRRPPPGDVIDPFR